MLLLALCKNMACEVGAFSTLFSGADSLGRLATLGTGVVAFLRAPGTFFVLLPNADVMRSSRFYEVSRDCCGRICLLL